MERSHPEHLEDVPAFCYVINLLAPEVPLRLAEVDSPLFLDGDRFEKAAEVEGRSFSGKASKAEAEIERQGAFGPSSC